MNAYDLSGCRPAFEHNYGGGCVGYTGSELDKTVYTKGPVTVTISNSTITIDAYMIISGPISNDPLIDGIKSYWEGEYLIEGNNWRVIVNIISGNNRNNESIHVTTSMSYGRSNTTSIWGRSKQTSVTIYISQGPWISPNLEWKKAHEFGHCLGVGDYYRHVEKGEPGYPPYFQSIMNKPGTHAQSDDILMVIHAFQSGVSQVWRPTK